MSSWSGATGGDCWTVPRCEAAGVLPADPGRGPVASSRLAVCSDASCSSPTTAAIAPMPAWGRSVGPWVIRAHGAPPRRDLPRSCGRSGRPGPSATAPGSPPQAGTRAAAASAADPTPGPAHPSGSRTRLLAGSGAGRTVGEVLCPRRHHPERPRQRRVGGHLVLRRAQRTATSASTPRAASVAIPTSLCHHRDATTTAAHGSHPARRVHDTPGPARGVDRRPSPPRAVAEDTVGRSRAQCPTTRAPTRSGRGAPTVSLWPPPTDVADRGCAAGEPWCAINACGHEL